MIDTARFFPHGQNRKTLPAHLNLQWLQFGSQTHAMGKASAQRSAERAYASTQGCDLTCCDKTTARQCACPSWTRECRTG
eukprot:3419271-Pleurochrysis_carterae.AAC.2